MLHAANINLLGESIWTHRSRKTEEILRGMKRKTELPEPVAGENATLLLKYFFLLRKVPVTERKALQKKSLTHSIEKEKEKFTPISNFPYLDGR